MLSKKYLVLASFFVSPFLSVPLPSSLAVYALDGYRRGKDISGSNNPTASLIGTGTAPGPDGRRDGSIKFHGRRNSYVRITNSGRLDAQFSITIIVWMFHDGVNGPFVHYNPQGLGVELAMTGRREIVARFVKRSSRYSIPLKSRQIKYRAWNYVATTFEQKTGLAKLYINSRQVAYKTVGRMRLATNYPLRLGAREGDRRYFRGRLFCLQIYSKPLSGRQIEAAKRKCFLPTPTTTPTPTRVPPAPPPRGK